MGKTERRRSAFVEKIWADADQQTIDRHPAPEEREKRREKKFLFKVEQNGKYNTSEFAITSTSHTICTT